MSGFKNSGIVIGKKANVIVVSADEVCDVIILTLYVPIVTTMHVTSPYHITS